jgi:hypothetical protein
MQPRSDHYPARSSFAGLWLGPLLALCPSGAPQQAPLAAPEWAARFAGPDARFDAAELERALAELDLDRRSSGDLSTALARARALSDRLRAEPAQAAEAGRAELDLAIRCALGELLLDSGAPAEAWSLLQAGLPATAGDQPPPAATERLAALRERARTSLAASLGLATASPQNALEQAVEAALVASPTSLPRLRALGKAAVPHLQALCRRDRDLFPTVDRQDPLTGLAEVDPQAFLDLAVAEFEAGGMVWRTRLLRPASTLLEYEFRKEKIRVALGDDLDRLLERLLLDPATAAALWNELNPYGGFLHHLPRVCVGLSEAVHAREPADGLGEILSDLRFRDAVIPVAERLATSPVDELRLRFARRVRDYVGEEPEARRVLLVLAQDPLEDIRLLVAQVLSETRSAEERRVRVRLLEDPAASVRVAALANLFGEEGLLRQTGPGPLGLPLADAEALAALGRASQRFDPNSSGAWGSLVWLLPAEPQRALLARMLASGQLDLISYIAGGLSDGRVGDPAVRRELLIELARACEPLDGGDSLIRAATSRGVEQPETFATLLEAAIEMRLERLLQALTWERRLGPGETDYQARHQLGELDPALAGRLIGAQCTPQRPLEASLAILANLDQAPAEALLAVMHEGAQRPELRLMAMAGALKAGEPEALSLFQEPEVWPALESALESTLAVGGGSLRWLSGFNTSIAWVSGPLRNQLAKAALDAEQLGDLSAQWLVSKLVLEAPEGPELAARAVARWRPELRAPLNRLLVRFVLVEAQGLPSVALDLELLRIALGDPQLSETALNVIVKRGGSALTSLIGEELDRIRPAKDEGDRDLIVDTQELLTGLARLGNPTGLALLAREAQLNPSAVVRKVSLQQLEGVRRLREAARWIDESGRLPRTRAEASAELLELLQSPDRRQRLGAIEGLGALGQPEVLPDLVRLLSGADAEFEAALQRAIARIAANPVPASAPQRPFVEPEPSGEGQGEDGEAAGSDE